MPCCVRMAPVPLKQRPKTWVSRIARLKSWMQRFHGVATQYLESYLGWFRAIDRTTSGLLNPLQLLAQAAGDNLVTNQLD